MSGTSAESDTRDRHDGPQSSDEIAAELQQTRVRIDETLDQLQLKLSLSRMADRIRHTGRSALDSAVRSVKRNPWPLVAAGSAMLWFVGVRIEDRWPRSMQLQRYGSRDRPTRPSLKVTTRALADSTTQLLSEKPLLLASLGLSLVAIAGYLFVSGGGLRNARPRGERRTIDEHTRLHTRPHS